MKFVIHRHSTVPDHYDLMLERGEALSTFRIDERDIGAFVRGERITALKIQDHRREYLTYEGPVSCNRGRVDLFDQGEYRVVENADGFFRVELFGKSAAGIFRFSLADGENCWTIARE
ncbi:MAG TPA: DNA polymerase ligase N-terminal domain-containing protein [Spirochaetota bacterium]|nr:DNA polymerase ligase N-terminal domain-containing protein [Spirochaetota bacterium]